jgi:predicted RNase H-like HicB family nuclease
MSEYVTAAMSHAVFEPVDGEDQWYAHIPGFGGLWAVGKTQEEAGQELHSALEGWLYMNATKGTGEAPMIDGLTLSEQPMRPE